MLRKLALAFALGGVVLTGAAPPVRADEGWRRHHDWREHEWREHHRYHRVYPAYPGYGYYYAPPPVVYAPPPAYYAPPGINFVFPLHIH